MSCDVKHLINQFNPSIPSRVLPTHPTHWGFYQPIQPIGGLKIMTSLATARLLNMASPSRNSSKMLSPKHQPGTPRAFGDLGCFQGVSGGIWKIIQLKMNIIFWVVVSNIFFFTPIYLGKMNPFWRAYFSDGVGSTTNQKSLAIWGSSIFSYVAYMLRRKLFGIFFPDPGRFPQHTRNRYCNNT